MAENTEKPKSLLPNGKRNPEYSRWYYHHKMTQDQKQRVLKATRAWRNTPVGKPSIKQYNESEAGKKSRERYFSSDKGKAALDRRRENSRDTPDEYAERIMRSLHPDAQLA